MILTKQFRLENNEVEMKKRTPEELERIYFDEIAPDLSKIAQKSASYGMEFLNLVDCTGMGYVFSVSLNVKRNFLFELILLVLAELDGQKNVNIDDFILAFAEAAERRGCPSTILERLGLSTRVAMRVFDNGK